MEHPLTAPNPATRNRSRSPAGGRPPSMTSQQPVVAEMARLTGRDRWILQLLDQHKVFTTEHLAAVGFGTPGRARDRLSTLHNRGVLDRFRHYVSAGSQSWRWTLGPVGAAVLAAQAGQPLPRPAAVRETTARLATWPQLGHLLGVNGFFTTLLTHSRRHHGEVQLVRWWSETQARQATGGLARPDGHGIWAANGRQVPFWLEYDTGTERPLSRVAGKLSDYANLAGTRWGLPLLFWLPTTARETNLHTQLARTGLAEPLVVATAAADHAQLAGGPAGPVWRLVGGTGRLHLADLPTGAGGDQQWGE